MKKSMRWLVPLAILLVTVLAGFVLLGNMERVLLMNARAILQSRVTQAINRAMDAALEKFPGENLVRMTRESETVYIRTDPTAMNTLSSLACETVQKQLNELCTVGVSLPLGAALGVDLLASWGPRIRVDVSQKSSVTGEYSSEFLSAGINQTVHRITLTVTAKLVLLLSSKYESFDVSQNMTVYEGLLAGEVPNSYFSGNTRPILDLTP